MLLTFAFSAAAGAFDFVPTRYDDPVPNDCLAEDCSLREAVIAANEAPGDDRILLSAGIYHLTLIGSGEDFSATGDLDLRTNVEIVGVGAPLSRIDALALGEQAIQAIGISQPVAAFRSLAVQNASANGLTLQAGTYTIEDCEFIGNGTLTTGHGVSMTIGGVATIRRSTFALNSGIGLSVTQGSATIQNSTFSGNGGAEILVNLAAAWSCTHCTIYDLGSPSAVLTVQGATALLANSIVVGVCSLPASGIVTSLGGTIESPGNTCGLLAPTDQHDVPGVALLLGSLASNGGPTLTQLMQAGSVAIAGALDALCMEEDQRGVGRTTDCESGSVEVTATAVLTPLFIDGFLQGDAEAWSATVE